MQKNNVRGNVIIKAILALIGTSGSFNSLKPSIVPSHKDLIDSAASSAASCCLVQNNEFKYHPSKCAKSTSLSLLPPSSSNALTISSSLQTLPNPRNNEPTSVRSIVPDLFKSNLSNNVFVCARIRCSEFIYHVVNLSFEITPVPLPSISFVIFDINSSVTSFSSVPNFINNNLNSSGSICPLLFLSNSVNTSLTSPLILATHATPAVSIISFLLVNNCKIPARNVDGLAKSAFESSNDGRLGNGGTLEGTSDFTPFSSSVLLPLLTLIG
mmetsp:Transcript_8293/g.9905  ORF Transcript_8293/g.9905 Transcript_8293/m.9905 type:complete len:270 (+) Transcript_8293:928-1737(+)